MIINNNINNNNNNNNNYIINIANIKFQIIILIGMIFNFIYIWSLTKNKSSKRFCIGAYFYKNMVCIYNKKFILLYYINIFLYTFIEIRVFH